jgi:DegV family protein with EDD domain
MAGIRVVTDSACDLTEELASAADITIVPLTIRFGDEELSDRKELSPEEFWRRCKGAATLPETAAPSPGAFQDAFEAAAGDGYDGVICLTISSGVSATYQSALAAAEAMSSRIPVRVVDTRTLSMGQGLMCLAVAEAAAAGTGLDELASLADDLVGRTRLFGVVDTLDHLQRGGRIGGLTALVGSMLSIKPVIEVKDGVVEQESKQRTRARSLQYLTDLVKREAPLDRLAVADGAAADIDVVLGQLKGIEVAHEMLVVQLGPVVGTHAGPGTIGVCFVLASRA